MEARLEIIQVWDEGTNETFFATVVKDKGTRLYEAELNEFEELGGQKTLGDMAALLFDKCICEL